MQKYEREGVPLYVYYPPRKKDESSPSPILLPEILTKELVLKVIEEEKPYFNAKADSFLALLGFAFLGGIILNLMPLVASTCSEDVLLNSFGDIYNNFLVKHYVKAF